MPSNDHLRAELSAAAARGTLHHALLISGMGERMDAARYAAAAYECTAQTPPCLHCTACRKVLGGIHPDVRVVRDEEHRLISVERVREVRADAYIIPNEGRRKVYIFDDCRRLDPRTQNILLKVVEEGPPYAAFLFLSESASALLPTLRSRCVELRMGAQEASNAPAEPLAEEFCRLLGEEPRQVGTFLLSLSAGKMKREELCALLEQTRELLIRAMLRQAGRREEHAPACVALAARLSQKTLMKLTELLRRHREDCDFNAGVGLLLGSLAAELEEIL